MEARRAAAAQAAADGRGWVLRLGARRCAGRGGGLRAVDGAGPRGAAAEPGARDGLPTPHRPGLAPLTGCPTADRVHLEPPGDFKLHTIRGPEVVDDVRPVRTGRYQAATRSTPDPRGRLPSGPGRERRCLPPTPDPPRSPPARCSSTDRRRASRSWGSSRSNGCLRMRAVYADWVVASKPAPPELAGRPRAHPSPHRPRHGHLGADHHQPGRRRLRAGSHRLGVLGLAHGGHGRPAVRRALGAGRSARPTCCHAAPCWPGRAACARC